MVADDFFIQLTFNGDQTVVVAKEYGDFSELHTKHHKH